MVSSTDLLITDDYPNFKIAKNEMRNSKNDFLRQVLIVVGAKRNEKLLRKCLVYRRLKTIRV